MIVVLIVLALLLSCFCSFILNKPYLAVLLIIIVSSRMVAQSSGVIYITLFAVLTNLTYLFFNTKQNKSLLIILFLPIAYILTIFLIKPYQLNINYYLGYFTALLIFVWVMFLKWDSRKIVYFLTCYIFYLVLGGFLEKIFSNSFRTGAVLTVATAYAVILTIAWTIWVICAFLSNIYSKKTILIGTFLVSIAIIFSGTRMGLIGMFIGAVLLCLFTLISKNKNINIVKITLYSFIIITLLLSLSVIVWKVLPNDLFIKKTFSTLIAGKLDESNMGRIVMWYSSINIIEQNKLLGIGAGNFPNKLKSFLQDFGIENFVKINSNTHSHNIYLMTLVEHGIIGFLTLGFFVFLCLLRAFVYFFKNKQKAVFFSLLAGFIVMAVLGLVDSIPMYLPTSGFAAWLLGTMFSGNNKVS